MLSAVERIRDRSAAPPSPVTEATIAALHCRDFGAGRADTLNTRIARLAADIDRALTAVNGQRAPIEGWSGLPTADQQRALGFAVDDARKAVTELNKLIATDIPAAYRAVANTEWNRKVRAVAMPR